MPKTLAVLDTMPEAADFYARYWNKRPFLVRRSISGSLMEQLVSADELAGLALEQEVQSRLVRTAGNQADWSCRFGPFTEQDLSDCGDKEWSLLVQNVERYHPPTAELLNHFRFSPRWMIDDVMVSFSAPMGSVGPHLDSYHVFLVQGQGRRRWKISRQPIENAMFLDNPEIKILADDFQGDTVEVVAGDVLYVPPGFAHEGTTLEAALTFSVGFLGPKRSELFGAYSQYLAEHEQQDSRFLGAGMTESSANYMIEDAVVDQLRAQMAGSMEGPEFAAWLCAYFTEPVVEDPYRDEPEVTGLSETEFRLCLENGASLRKPAQIKFALTGTPADGYHLGADGRSVRVDAAVLPVLALLMTEQSVDLATLAGLGLEAAGAELLWALYDLQVLELTED